jgi:hypothetical protein
MPAPAGRRRTPRRSPPCAQAPAPPASAPWRAYARVERARVAGGAAGVAPHGRCRAGCRPLRGRGVSGGRFAPPARICRACGRRAAAACVDGAAGGRCCGCMQPGASRDDIQPACWAGWLCWPRVLAWHAGCGAWLSASCLVTHIGCVRSTQPVCGSEGARCCSHARTGFACCAAPLACLRQGSERGGGRTVARVASLAAEPACCWGCLQRRIGLIP